MSLFRLYARVLQLLGKEGRLGWILAAANMLLATAQFAEPVLFGRIIDALSTTPATGGLAALLSPHTDVFDHIEPDLTIQGLAILWERAHIA